MGIERDRVRLAACVRLLHMEGLLTYNGHVSVRIPDANRFLIHSLVTLEASWPEGFRQHYASKIWRYYVGKGLGAGLIPKAWSEDLL